MKNLRKYYKRSEVVPKKPVTATKLVKKLKEEEVAAAQVYEDYLATFTDESKTLMNEAIANPTQFIKSGVVGASNIEQKTSENTSLETNVTTGGTSENNNATKGIVGENISNINDASFSFLSGTLGFLDSLEKYKSDVETWKNKAIVKNKPKVSNLVSFKEELVKKHCEEKQNIFGLSDFRFDENSTNLHVGSIHQNVTEEDLCEVFGKFGSLASVKVMPGKTTDPNFKPWNYGFVAFMKRSHAIYAMKALARYKFYNIPIYIDWAKALPVLPEVPYYLCENPIVPTESESAIKIDKESLETKHVTVPSNMETLCLIHTLCEFVINYGLQFELLIISREYNNKKFRFLHDVDSPEYLYYRWKLFNLLKSGCIHHNTDKVCRLYQNSFKIQPPKINNTENSKYMEPKNFTAYMTMLPSKIAAKLALLTSKLNGSRRSTARVMIWALRNAHLAKAVVDQLTFFILSNETKVDSKIFIFHAIHDILYNSACPLPKAYDYRRRIEVILPVIAKHFNSFYKKSETTSEREFIKQNVLPCFESWKHWGIFTPQFVRRLKSALLGIDVSELEDEDDQKSEDKYGNDNNGDESPINLEDIDGMPLSEELLLMFHERLIEIHSVMAK